MRNKYTPYVLGLICAVMFYLVHIVTQASGVNFFSEAVMGETAFLFALLTLVPLLLERIAHTNGRRVGKGLRAIHWVKLCIMALAFICSVLAAVFMFTQQRITALNIFTVTARLASCVMFAAFWTLMLSAGLKSALLIRISGWTLLAGAVTVVCFMHMPLLGGLVAEIAGNVGQVPGSLLFIYAFVNIVYILCLFLVDGTAIYLAVRTARRADGKLPLEYL